MRYIKLLIFAVFFFLAMVFFFQNQEPLSQQMTLSLNLFFIPPMTSIPLPFYFIVIAAFFIGCLLAVCFLWWDRVNASARFMRSKWKIKALEEKVAALDKQLNSERASHAPALPAASVAQAQPAQPRVEEKSHSFFHHKKKEEEKAPQAQEQEQKA